jgi:hypothetical protein
MANGSGGTKMLTWAALRPVLVGMSLTADAFIVLVLVISKHKGWLPPFIGFGIVLMGLIWFMGWSLRHRHDDDPAS